MNLRCSDLRLPTECGEGFRRWLRLSRRTPDLHHAGTNLATGLLRLGMTAGSRVSFTSFLRVRQRAVNSAAEIVLRTTSRVSWSSESGHIFIYTYTSFFSRL